MKKLYIMYFIKTCRVLFFFLVLSSCDHVVGENGVVENGSTGERIENVQVTLSSEPADFTVFTDSDGSFDATKTYKCGPLERCSPDFILTFEKEGFQSRTIDVDYRFSPSAEFVTEGTKDTLVIKMMPN